MEIARLFRSFHDELRRTSWQQTKVLPEAQWRSRPHGLNSIAWLVWHMARVEDSGVNRLVFDQPQVLDDPGGHWMERLNVPLRHHGTTMTSAEVDDLTARVTIAPLCAYAEAVAQRSQDLVSTLRPGTLDDRVETTHLRRVLFDEGMLRPDPLWQEMQHLPYSEAPKEVLLFHFGVTHNYGHVYDIRALQGLLQAQ